jgi:hypothetical protein
MAATAALLPAGPLPGLHTVPDGLGWVAARLPWLAAFALALAVCGAAFRTWERGGGRPLRRVRPSRVVRAHRPTTERAPHV